MGKDGTDPESAAAYLASDAAALLSYEAALLLETSTWTTTAKHHSTLATWGTLERSHGQGGGSIALRGMPLRGT